MRDLTERDFAAAARIAAGLEACGDLDALNESLLLGLVALIPCEHASYNELDPAFGRALTRFTEDGAALVPPELHRVWDMLMPQHPILKRLVAAPAERSLRISDVADPAAFRETALWRELYRHVGTDHQLVVSFGAEPGEGATLPVILGVALNRRGRDFTARERALGALVQSLAAPILRRRRSARWLGLLDAPALDDGLARRLVGLGLSARQAEVLFWMLKGKSNSEIGEILSVSAQTARTHSMRIFEALEAPGRLAAQGKALRALMR